MTTQGNDAQFWQLVDMFINTANAQVKNVDSNIIGPALLFSAARFNTYMHANAAGNKATFSEHKEAVLKYYLEQHEKMLRENLADFEQNFDKYAAFKPPAAT